LVSVSLLLLQGVSKFSLISRSVSVSPRSDSVFGRQGKHDPTKPNESDAGMMFGATIHTLNGLNVKVKRRVHA
jgi:hypothetical protein